AAPHRLESRPEHDRRSDARHDGAERGFTLDRLRRVVPPPPAVGCDLPGPVVGHAAGAKLALNDRAALPVLELQRPETLAHPLVEGCEDPGCLGESEVRLPARQVRPELRANLREAAPGVPPGHLAHTILPSRRPHGSTLCGSLRSL